MGTIVVGDVQGCALELQQLLDKTGFDPRRDQIWFVGDLVNRGPDSLGVLRMVMAMEERAITVLGNHELHMLAIAHGIGQPRPADTFEDVLQAPDRDEIFQWLLARPLIHTDRHLGWTMVHAGLPPQWTLDQTLSLADEAQQVLRRPGGGGFFEHMYGDKPDLWPDSDAEPLQGWERIRFIINCFTRIRICSTEGRLDLGDKGAPGGKRLPWFRVPGRQSREHRVVFGHWSTLGFYHGDNVLCMDSGCLWGGQLSAIRLDRIDKGGVKDALVQISCAQKQPLGV